MKVFKIGDKVSIAVPHQDRSSTDDKRIFGCITKVYKDNYTIQTKYGILDRQYPTSQLMPLSANTDLDFSDPPVLKKITLHYAAAQESTSEKLPVHCGCSDKQSWCCTRRCACFKANVDCSLACHGGHNGGDLCPNFAPAETQTQKGLKVRDTDISLQQSPSERQLKRKSRKRLPTLTKETSPKASKIPFEVLIY